MDKAPNAPRGNLVGAGWPSFRYYPGGVAQVFQRPEDVPEGWQDTPEKAAAWQGSGSPEAAGKADAKAAMAEALTVLKPPKLPKVKGMSSVPAALALKQTSAFPAPNLDDLE